MNGVEDVVLLSDAGSRFVSLGMFEQRFHALSEFASDVVTHKPPQGMASMRCGNAVLNNVIIET